MNNMPLLADSTNSPHELKNQRGKDYNQAAAQEQMPNGEASDDENSKVALATARNQKARKQRPTVQGNRQQQYSRVGGDQQNEPTQDAGKGAKEA
jgi:hypothetical protein